MPRVVFHGDVEDGLTLERVPEVGQQVRRGSRLYDVKVSLQGMTGIHHVRVEESELDSESQAMVN